MIGYGSEAVNDQLIPLPPQTAFHPLVFGQISESYWPMVGSYQQPPVMSPQFTNFGNTPPWSGYTSGAGSAPATSSAASNPFHLTKSPLWWALGFLALSLFVLHKVFWKGD